MTEYKLCCMMQYKFSSMMKYTLRLARRLTTQIRVSFCSANSDLVSEHKCCWKAAGLKREHNAETRIYSVQATASADGYLLFAALALFEVHPALLSFLRLSIQLGEPLLALPTLLKLLLLGLGLVIVLVCDLHVLHHQEQVAGMSDVPAMSNSDH